MSLAEVEQARVHITFPKDSLFPGHAPARQGQRAGEAASGRATVGRRTSRPFASSPPARWTGCSPRRSRWWTCAGICSTGHAKLLRPTIREPSEAALEYRQKLEHDLLAKINTTLEPLLGADKFRATASVECDFTSAEQSDESYDPSKSVMVNSQKTEDISGGAVAAGVPGTPSTLPRPASRARRVAAIRSRGEPRTSATNPATPCATCASHRAPSSGCRFRSWWIPTCATRAPAPRPNGSSKPPSADKLKVDSRSGGGRHRVFRRAGRSTGGGDAAL